MSPQAPPMNLPLLLPILVLLGLGLWLTIRGLRGRRVGDHPYCRRCGFDLFGLPTGQARCPECGAELSRRRAAVVGERRRLRIALAVGLLMMLLPLGVWSIVRVVRARNVNRLAHAPTWYLVRVAREPVPQRSDAATVELIDRLHRGRLSDAQVAAVADAMLALQGDRSRRWLPHWGDFIEEAQLRDRLTRDRLDRYLAQALSASLTVRPRVRRGVPVPSSVATGQIRLSAVPGLAFRLEYAGLKLKGVDGEGAALPGAVYLDRRTVGFSIPRPLDAADIPLRIAEGPQQLTARLRLAVSRTMDAAPDVQLAQQDITAAGSFLLLPYDQLTVRTLHDPSLREPMRQAIVVVEVRNGDDGRVLIHLRTVRPPVTFCGYLWLRSGAREWRCDAPLVLTTFESASHAAGVHTMEQIKGHVQIVLRPVVAHAIQTTNLTEIWGEDIVIDDVPVDGEAK